MIIVLVNVLVKPDCVEEFIIATQDNAMISFQEAGIARFDVIQAEDDPTKFVLVEVYRTIDAVLAHKESEHYLRWRSRVADMMAEPRVGIKYKNCYPTDESW